MYRPVQTSYTREETPQLQIQMLPKNKETDAHLRKYQMYEDKLSDFRKAYSVIERSAGRRIACFTSPTYGFQPEHYRDANRGQKRTVEGGDVSSSYEVENTHPRVHYEERQEARKQLPIYKEQMEEVEMLQAEYVFELRQRCVHHHYAVFCALNMSPEKSKLNPDMADALCLHCFQQIPQEEAERYMIGSNPVVYVYQSIVDFHSKIWNSGGGGDTGGGGGDTGGGGGNSSTLQPLF